VCPGARRSAELVRARAGHTRVAVRDLRTLRVVRSRRAPADSVELRCADRRGTALFAAAVDYPRAHRLGRARVVRLTPRGPRTIATLSGDAVALARGAAYVADQDTVRVLDLAGGAPRPLGPFPDAGQIAPSPDGTRVALSAAGHGARLLELPSGRSLGHAPAGQLTWLSPKRLLVRGVGSPRLYDGRLRPLRRLPWFRAVGQAPVGSLVFGVDRRRLVALDLRGGRPSQVAVLPDPDTHALVAVPGAPRVRVPRVAPGVPRATSVSAAAENIAARNGSLALVDLEVALARAADGAEPVVRDVLERGARRDPAIGISLGGVVDEPAGGADVELLGRHGRGSLAVGGVRLAPCASTDRHPARSSIRARPRWRARPPA